MSYRCGFFLNVGDTAKFYISAYNFDENFMALCRKQSGFSQSCEGFLIEKNKSIRLKPFQCSSGLKSEGKLRQRAPSEKWEMRSNHVTIVYLLPKQMQQQKTHADKWRKNTDKLHVFTSTPVLLFCIIYGIKQDCAYMKITNQRVWRCQHQTLPSLKAMCASWQV